MAGKRIGILGGSFNPIHNAHLRLAVEAVEQAGLDSLELVPAAQPPHKRDLDMLAFPVRCRYLELAVQGFDWLSVNTLEGEREGPSYTVDTLRQYTSQYSGQEIFFLLGADEFLNLPTWHSWERIPELAHLILACRGERDSGSIAEFISSHFPRAELSRQEPAIWDLPGGNSMQLISLPRMDISSTQIRNKLSRGLSLAWLVPEAVRRELERDVA